MGRLMQNHLFKALQEHERIVELYKREYSEDRKTRDGKRDWRTYEQRLALRIKTAAQELEPIAQEAYSMIALSKNMGAPEKVPVYKKVMLLLLKDIFQLSNRKMANFLAFFTALTGIDISYKTVERIYSDDLARMTLHNMFMIMVKKKGIKNANTSGDGTGYSLTVTKHYRNEREKELKRIKESKEPGSKKENEEKGKRRRSFVRSFALMDIDTRMYIGYGTSMNSEQEAFSKALEMAKLIGISINIVRLDKLYSYQSITMKFDRRTKIYIIPKSNATIRGPPEWKKILREFVEDQFSYLKEYYKRNNSEGGFSDDKRLCGWKIWQKREDRIDLALTCKGVWHNLMWLG